MGQDSRESDDHGHIPVLLDRCVELLTPALTRQHRDGTGAVLVDATLGAGGHAERFLTEFPGLRVIGLDRDPDALWIAGERLAGFGDRVLLVRTRYDGIEGVLAETDYWASKVDGILFDLGVSSMQLDRTERGFSYASDAPLDMRMDPDAPLTAADVLNTYDERTLARLLREFGEERFAGRIAAQIVRRRASIDLLPPPVSWWSCCIRPSPRRRAAPVGIRPSAPSRRCASSSTASSIPCVTPCPPLWARWPPAAGSW